MSEHRNIRVTIEYDGSGYHGWQSQKNASTIQDTFESALLKLTGEKIRITGSGRTDTGVHAKGQVANFVLKKLLTLSEIEDGLNAHLPKDIVVKKVELVSFDFNARFDAKKRIYQYYILPSKTAIFRNYCWQIYYKFDYEVLQNIAMLIAGEYDFSAFSKIDETKVSKKCRVYNSEWKENAGFYIYHIEANRFLHGMVRTIVGTMMDVARGRFTSHEFREILLSKDRNQAGQTAPPQGLFLEEVHY
jgi:tRNA pseudouridine38-40 synthase